MNITEAFKNALLSQAAYVINSSQSEENLLKDLSNEFGATLAKYINDNFSLDFNTIIDKHDLFGSGFDANIWTGNATNY